MENNQNMFKLEQQAIFDFSDPDATISRLLIPKDLQVFAGISKNIVLSSAVNIIEIWDKDRYELAIDDASGDTADLAEEVMGNANNNNGIS